MEPPLSTKSENNVSKQGMNKQSQLPQKSLDTHLRMKTLESCPNSSSILKRVQDIEEDKSSSSKRQKIIPEHWDPEVFESLPNDVKDELLRTEKNKFERTPSSDKITKAAKTDSVSRNLSSSTSTTLPKKLDDIPENWDAQVFNNLPQELQKELLHNQKKDKTPKKTPNSSILNYFTKK